MTSLKEICQILEACRNTDDKDGRPAESEFKEKIAHEQED